jgi:hypothetical protein
MIRTLHKEPNVSFFSDAFRKVKNCANVMETKLNYNQAKFSCIVEQIVSCFIYLVLLKSHSSLICKEKQKVN